MGDEWLLDESRTLTAAEALEATQQELGFDRATEPAINVALFDVTIHDTKKWFGRAQVRIDALVITPAPAEDQLYQANTFTFPGVRDGQALPIDRAASLGLYTGWPQYLLDGLSSRRSAGRTKRPWARCSLIALTSSGACSATWPR